MINNLVEKRINSPNEVHVFQQNGLLRKCDKYKLYQYRHCCCKWRELNSHPSYINLISFNDSVNIQFFKFIFLFRYTDKYTLEEIALKTFETTHLVGLDNIEVNVDKEELLKCDLFKQWTNTLRNNKDNFNLATGAVIANDMRNAVKEKTGFSCSAGIGPNKVIILEFHVKFEI